MQEAAAGLAGASVAAGATWALIAFVNRPRVECIEIVYDGRRIVERFEAGWLPLTAETAGAE